LFIAGIAFSYLMVLSREASMQDRAHKLLAFLIILLSAAASFLFCAAMFSRERSAPDIKPKTVLEMTGRELKESYHGEFSGVNFESDQGILFSLLKNVGNNVESFFRNFVNTSCKEKVHLYNGRSWYNKEFSYLIFPQKDATLWTEDRADNKGRRGTLYVPGFTISKGYAYTCIYLHPDHQKCSSFRYLGRQKKKPGAHVIAFAQKPEAQDYLTSYANVDLQFSMNFLVQGFVWVDPKNYQILRIMTEMMLPSARLKEQTTDIYYQEVRFKGIQQPFWLPKEVSISWRLSDRYYRNQHEYSDFRLFSVETEYKLDRPQTNK
jgi:hypothetical protein